MIRYTKTVFNRFCESILIFIIERGFTFIKIAIIKKSKEGCDILARVSSKNNLYFYK